MMHFPMTSNIDEKEKAWKNNALTIIDEVRQGKLVAFLTLGDSMTYSTYGYILRQVKTLAPELPVISVPGITSYQAAAACLNTPLVEGEEPLLVVSGVNGGNCLRRFAAKPDNVVFMKAYRHVKDIAAALSEADMLDGSVAVKNCGLPDQEIVYDIGSLENDPPTYWTLILAKRRSTEATPTP
jgi:precorrin-2/cobalt-factor-2 C20-methyltransferase